MKIRLFTGALLVTCGFVGCGGQSDGGLGSAGGSAGTAAGGTSGGATGGTSGGGVGGTYGACSASSECVIAPNECCPCGEQTLLGSTAVNAKQQAAFYDSLQCGDVLCGDCAVVPNANLIATCDGGQCTAVDLQQELATECTKPDDCILRTNACCECGGQTDQAHLVAVARSQILGLQQLTCGPMIACPECGATPPPDNAEASCEAGRCVVLYSLDN